MVAYNLLQQYLRDPKVGRLTLIVQSAADEAEIRDRLGSPPSLHVLSLGYYPSLRELHAVRQAVRAIRTSDVVHFNEFPFRHLPLMLLARMQARPCVLTLHGVLSGEVGSIFGSAYPFVFTFGHRAFRVRFPRGTGRFLLWVFRRCTNAWSAVVAPSRATAVRGAAEDGFDPSTLTVIPNGVGALPAAPRAPHDGPPRLLFVGKLEPVKGPDLLVAALRRLSDTGVSLDVGVVGDGSLEPSLRSQASALGAHRITFHGRRTGGAVEELYRWSDFVVVPSRYDSFPGVLLEAMAAGRPVVATRVGGIPEIATDGRNAILVDPTPEGIEDGIRRLLQDPHLLRSMAEANVIDVQRFTWRGAAKEYVSLYEGLCAGGRPSAAGAA